MIRRELRLESGPAWLLLSQPEHARLARDLAGAWKAGPWLPLEPLGEMLAAIERHDDGWVAPDASPVVDASTGRPRDFLETPLADALEIWTGSVQSARSQGLLAGYVVARHFQRLLAQRTLAPEVRAGLASQRSESALADNYRRLLEGTADPEARWLLANHPIFGPANPAASWLAEWLAGDRTRTAERAEQAVDQLQLFDWLSLWLCMAERDAPHTLSPGGGPPVTLTPLPTAPTPEAGTPHHPYVVEVSPWPFRAGEVLVSAAGRVAPQQNYGDASQLAGLPAVERTLTWHFVPGPTQRAWSKRLAGVSCEPLVEHYPLLTSTNDRARQLADGPLPALVVADQQTAGRGRGANVWWTGEGSLAMSLTLDPQEWRVPRSEGPLASLAVAVALVDVLTPRLPLARVGLHWPNDVYVDAGPGERKIAGILIEGLPGGKLVVGIGLNVNNTLSQAPAELQSIATTLIDLTGQPHDRLDLAAELVEGFTALLAELGRDGAAIVERADRACLQHGRTLTIETPREQVTGVCRGLAPDGALVLETPGGLRTFHGGVLRRNP